MTRWPPRTSPEPWTVNGNDDAGPPSGAVTATPRPARASMMVPMGRLRACGSPSKRDSPRRSAATGGTKRMTVPARPQSIAVSADAGSMLIGTISRSGPKAPSPGTSVTVAPNCRRASIISAESRECRGARSREGPSARAASTRYRLVRDLDPGTATVASTGRAAKGAGQCVPASAAWGPAAWAPAGWDGAAAEGVVPVITVLGPGRVVYGLADDFVGLLQLLVGGLAGIGGEVSGALLGIGGQMPGAPGQAGLAGGIDRGEEHAAGEGDVFQELFAAGVAGFLRGDVRAAPFDVAVQERNDGEQGGRQPGGLAEGEADAGTDLGAADHACHDFFIWLERQGVGRTAQQGGQLRRSVIRVLELVHAGEDETGGEHGPGEKADKRHEFPPGWTNSGFTAGEPVLVLHFCGIFARRTWL